MSKVLHITKVKNGFIMQTETAGPGGQPAMENAVFEQTDDMIAAVRAAFSPLALPAQSGPRPVQPSAGSANRAQIAETLGKANERFSEGDPRVQS